MTDFTQQVRAAAQEKYPENPLLEGYHDLGAADVFEAGAAFGVDLVRQIQQVEINRLAQHFYENSGLVLSHTSGKPHLIAGLTAVLEKLGYKVTE